MESAFRLTPQSLVEHREFVLALARRLTRDESSAEDLAQEAMAAALAKPPEERGVRGWFASVLRSRAVDRARSERRRESRERVVARAEAQASPLSATERVELSHGVVAAVLALDEPYRSVVIGIYYEGLTPAQYAARSGLQASTVRSQLSRALEHLRARLDREHGDRRVWSAALAAWIEGEELAVTTGLSSAVGVASWVAWAAGVAVVGAFAVAWLASQGPVRDDGLAGAAVPSHASAGEARRAEAADELAVARKAILELDAHGEVTPSDSQANVPLDRAQQLAQWLERTRQIKVILLDRALAVAPSDEEAFASEVHGRRSGVVRLLERQRFSQLELPWMRQGGSYYSFTERVHDFNRWPQVALEGGMLQASGEGGVIDVGERRLDELGRYPPSGVDYATAVRYDALWIEPPAGDSRSWRLDGAFAERITEELASDRLAPDVWQDLARGAAVGSSPARVGRSYLLRSRSAGEFDVLVALQVASVDDNGCTLAWRELKRWPAEQDRSSWVPKMQHHELPAPPKELRELGDAELWAELERTKSAARALLFDSFSADIEARFGALRARSDSGLARLTAYFGEWSELGPGFLQGAAVSLVTGMHDTQDTHLGFWGDHRAGASLSPGLDGGVQGALLDLGTVPLESVGVHDVERLAGDAGRVLVSHRFFAGRDGVQSEHDAVEAEQASVRAFQTQLRAAGVALRRVDAHVGHTYALRAVRFNGHDVLAIVHVVALDELGAVIAWRLLEARKLR